MNQDKFKTLWYALFKEASRSSLREWLDELNLSHEDLDAIQDELTEKLGFEVGWMKKGSGNK